MSSVPGRHGVDYAPPLGMWEKSMLFGGSVQVRGNNGLVGVDTHPRIATIGAILASTYSLLLLVPGVPSQNRGGRTRTNNTRTDNPLVSSPRRSELGGTTHLMRFFQTKYTRSALGVSGEGRFLSEKVLASSDNVRK